MVFDSTGKNQHQMKEEEEPCRPRRKMTFESEEAMLLDSESGSSTEEPNCRGIRVVDVKVNESSASSSFDHWFVPL